MSLFSYCSTHDTHFNLKHGCAFCNMSTPPVVTPQYRVGEFLSDIERARYPMDPRRFAQLSRKRRRKERRQLHRRFNKVLVRVADEMAQTALDHVWRLMNPLFTTGPSSNHSVSAVFPPDSPTRPADPSRHLIYGATLPKQWGLSPILPGGCYPA